MSSTSARAPSWLVLWLLGAVCVLAACGSRSPGHAHAGPPPDLSPGGDSAPPGATGDATAVTTTIEETASEEAYGDDSGEVAAPPQPPQSPQPKPTTGGSGLGEPMQSMLDAHNRYRAAHCAPPLAWSSEIAALAQGWANKLRDRGCAFAHSEQRRYGENLAYYGPAGEHSGSDAVAGWYEEINQYDFRKPGFDFSTGHFTQVVWVGTTELGCGVARCADNRAEIWVCNYGPPGNMIGDFPRSVLPASCRR